MSFPDGRFLRQKFYKEYPGRRRPILLAEGTKNGGGRFWGEEEKEALWAVLRAPV